MSRPRPRSAPRGRGGAPGRVRPRGRRRLLRPPPRPGAGGPGTSPSWGRAMASSTRLPSRGLWALACALWLGSAAAAPAEQAARERFQAGTLAYDVGDFQRALDAYT